MLKRKVIRRIVESISSSNNAIRSFQKAPEFSQSNDQNEINYKGMPKNSELLSVLTKMLRDFPRTYFLPAAMQNVLGLPILKTHLSSCNFKVKNFLRLNTYKLLWFL